MLAIGGCSEALPNQDLRAVGEQTRIVASTYAAETKQNAEAAEAKLKRAEELLREARELTARAEAAEKRCAERAARVEKAKPVIINKCPQQPAPTTESQVESSSGAVPKPTSTPSTGSLSSGHPVTTPAAQATATPAEHIEPAPQKDPEFSPSDAPL